MEKRETLIEELEINLEELEELEDLAWLGSNGNGGTCCNDTSFSVPLKLKF